MTIRERLVRWYHCRKQAELVCVGLRAGIEPGDMSDILRRIEDVEPGKDRTEFLRLLIRNNLTNWY